MAEKVVGGLKWVKGEIAMTLRRVRGLVETYGQTSEPSALSDAVEALFEVRGVLLALQLTLPARLVDEMQRLCDAMAERRVRSPGEAAEAMMLALIQLPSHLDRLDAGAEVLPLSLWPTINDLRESRGAPPLTPAELLVPGSVLAMEDEDLPPEALEALAAALRKVRPHFHRHLVDWYRPSTAAEGLIKLSRLFQQLHRFIKDGILADLFRLAEAYAAGLQRGQVAADSAARALVGRLDRVFKPLVTPPPAWPEAEIRDLIDEFLTELDQAEVQPVLVAEIRAHCARPAVDLPMSEGAPEALAGLAEAMLGELAILKECLDLFVRGEHDDRTPLAALRTGMRNLARALEGADTGDTAERLRFLAGGFGDLATADAATDAVRLQPLTAELLGIEAVLQAYAAQRPRPAHGERAPGLAAMQFDATPAAPAPLAAPAPDDPAAGAASALRGYPGSGRAGAGIAPEFLDVFLEDARAELDSIGEQFVRWGANPGDEVALAQLRRGFHAIKGSGRLVGAERVADLAQVAEDILNRLIEHSLSRDADLLAYLAEVVDLMPELVNAEVQNRPLDTAGLLRRAAVWVQSPPSAAVPSPFSPFPPLAAVGPAPVDPVTPPAAEGLLIESADRWFEAQPGRSAPTVTPPRAWPPGARALEDHGSAAVADDSDSVSRFAADPELMDLFRGEMVHYLDDLRAFLGRAAAGQAVPDEATVRALHTLNGSAGMAGIDSIAQVAQSLEQRLRPFQTAASRVPAALLDLIERALGAIAARIAEVPAGGAGVAALGAVAAALAALPELGPEPESESGPATIGVADSGFAEWSAPVLPGGTQNRAAGADSSGIDLARRDSDLEDFLTWPSEPGPGLEPDAQGEAQSAEDLFADPFGDPFAEPGTVVSADSLPDLLPVAVPPPPAQVSSLPLAPRPADEDSATGADALAAELAQALSLLDGELASDERRGRAGDDAVPSARPAVVPAVASSDARDWELVPLDLPQWLAAGEGIDQETPRLSVGVPESFALVESADAWEPLAALPAPPAAASGDEPAADTDGGVAGAPSVGAAPCEEPASAFTEVLAPAAVDPPVSAPCQSPELSPELPAQAVHDGLPCLEPPLLSALLVGVAGQVYAVPQAGVAGVARIPRDDLAAIYAGQGRDFSASDGRYRVAHLGRLLDPTTAPDLDQRRWLPLLLMRAGAPRLALQVDQVIGSTHITVTPLGPGLAAVRWLVGGTILADGRVALILDAQALVQAADGQDEGPGTDGTAAAAPRNQEEPGPLAPALAK